MRHALLFLLILPGCACDEEAPEPSPEGLSYPRLLVRADMKATLLARQNLPVFSDLYKLTNIPDLFTFVAFPHLF